MKRSLLIFFPLSLLPVFAVGESRTPLTWQDSVALAARKNPTLLSALRAMEASRAQYLGSYNGILPQLNLTNSYSQSSASRSVLLSDETSATTTSSSKIWQAQGTASLDLIDFGQWASIRSTAAAWRQNQATAQLASS